MNGDTNLDSPAAILGSVPVTCPPPGDVHPIQGCGSANIEGPDDEGFYDCLDCGIWF
jgi:hypothetical protein